MQMHWSEAVSSALNFPFLKALAELLRFDVANFENREVSQHLAAFLMCHVTTKPLRFPIFETSAVAVPMVYLNGLVEGEIYRKPKILLLNIEQSCKFSDQSIEYHIA